MNFLFYKKIYFVNKKKKEKTIVIVQRYFWIFFILLSNLKLYGFSLQNINWTDAILKHFVVRKFPKCTQDCLRNIYKTNFPVDLNRNIKTKISKEEIYSVNINYQKFS